MSMARGLQAESWDVSPDMLTYTFNIREGVKWHNKAPMNGRELTAADVVFNFERNLGLGDFAEAGRVLLFGLSPLASYQSNRRRLSMKVRWLFEHTKPNLPL